MTEMAVMWDNHRHTPASLIPEYVKAIEASKVIDYFWVLDELSGYFPEVLWKPQNSALAGIRDVHSTVDPFVTAAIATAASSKIGLRFSSDAVRNRPAELMRTMLTLAGATEGQTVMCLGAGEARQLKPFGYNSAEGMARFEDMFKLMKLFWENDKPFSYKGNVWEIRNGYLGDHRPKKRPQFWALGGGPKLIEIAAEHADGFETVAPFAFTLDGFAEKVREIKQKVAGYGRDPDKFGIGVWLAVGVHDDPEKIQFALRNPLIRTITAAFGRMNMADWAKEGMQSVMPMDYHYSKRYKPFDLVAEEVMEIVSRVPPEMVHRAMYWGTPQEIAAVARQFVDAGATFVGLCDLLPLVLPFEEHAAVLPRLFDTCRLVKESEVTV